MATSSKPDTKKSDSPAGRNGQEENNGRGKYVEPTLHVTHDGRVYVKPYDLIRSKEAAAHFKALRDLKLPTGRPGRGSANG